MVDADVCALLREGDTRGRAGDHVAAVDAYAHAARFYQAKGEWLKAIALLRQVRAILAEHAPQERLRDDEARSRLPSLYRAIGLEEEALAVENEAPQE